MYKLTVGEGSRVFVVSFLHLLRRLEIDRVGSSSSGPGSARVCVLRAVARLLRSERGAVSALQAKFSCTTECP